MRPLTPADRATLGTIVTRFPGLAAAVHTQVTRLLAAVLPASDGAIATEGQLDELLGSVVARVVARSSGLRATRSLRIRGVNQGPTLARAQADRYRTLYPDRKSWELTKL
jgi:hypothetical protein